ncbi:hypothetical protein CEXT_746571 [Caerostris extrusa]|uniref:Uncharacterized protein n=1 Tax=Caerostris extrusa TaxID=172846 RepID=A0AAV4VEP7_CAEEX|nr:hypothetical protein CEXT_746571 [Caerostris extrusa]
MFELINKLRFKCNASYNFLKLGATVEWVDVTQIIEEMKTDKDSPIMEKLVVDRIREAAEYAATGPQHDKKYQSKFKV